MKRSLVWSLMLFFFLVVPAATYAASSLSSGDRGDSVVVLQNYLIKLGYLAKGYNTGYFGPLTQTAVEKFQCAKGIICSGASVEGYGIYGPRTQAAMQIALAPKQPATVEGASLTPAATGPFEVSGWLPHWRASSSTLDVLPHLSQLKSVMPFGYTVNSQGHLVDTAHLGEEPWPSFIAAAKAAGVRVVPTVVWGNGAQEHAILSNTTKRIALEDEIANLVKEKGYDGIDIDFEAKQAQTINYFSTFLRGLYQRMGQKWVYCTIEARMPLEDRYSPGATIPDDATDYANDYIEMNKYCDRVEIMAYDQGTIDVRFNAARSAPYAPVADPGWVENIVSLVAQTISRNKIILGIPTYGYEYLVTPLADGSLEYKMLWPFNPNYAIQIAAQLGITPHRTSAGELGFIYDPNMLASVAPSGGNSTLTQQHAVIPTTAIAHNLGSQVNTAGPYNYVTWSDSAAMSDKIDLAKKLGLRGVAFFSLGGAEDPAMWYVLPQ